MNVLDLVLNDDGETIADMLIQNLPRNTGKRIGIKAKILVLKRRDVQARLMWWHYSSDDHKMAIAEWALKAGFELRWDEENNQIKEWVPI